MAFDVPFWISLGTFAFTFFFILTERIHRTVIALFGAMAMIVLGILFNFYHPNEALEAIDFNTIGLLFGMMVLIAILEKTGFFQYLGIITAKKTRGIPWLLLLALGFVTSVLSMVLDNVTTIILIAPITIVIAKMLSINPVPLLVGEAILSNVGGTATLVGDPPNIIIGSAAGFTFNDFLIHSLPVVVVAWIVTIVVLRFTYRKELLARPQNLAELEQMRAEEAITDRKTLVKTLVVLSIVILLFFFHGALHIPPALVALIGAALALIAVSPSKDPQAILEKTELSVLLFFGSLFILVGGLEHAGVLEYAATFITQGAAENILLTAIIIMWAAAILSAIVDNIPLTVAMVPIIGFLSAEGISVDILWWALVLGVGFGGNGSPIGATANVIVMAKSEQAGFHVSFIDWIKKGGLSMVASLFVATAAFILFGSFWIGS